MKRLVDAWVGYNTRKLRSVVLGRMLECKAAEETADERAEMVHSMRSGQRTVLHTVGVLWNPKAIWVGAHYSKRDKRLCINLVPCLTFWWAKPGGVLP